MDSDFTDELEAVSAARDADERAIIAELFGELRGAEALRRQPDLTEADRARLDAAIAATRAAIERFVALRDRGQTRGVMLARVGQVAGGVVADDVTGIGVADNWLLVGCAGVALATYALTDGAAPEAAVTAAWEAIESRRAALRAVATEISASVAACKQDPPASPEPVSPAEPAASPRPRPRPLPVPRPGEREDDQPERCRSRPACPHLGNDPIHDACADEVPPNTYPGCDVVVNGKHFDALDPHGALWEVKTDDWSSYSEFLKEKALREHIEAARIEHQIAAECRFGFVFAVSDKQLYPRLRAAVGPEGITVRHVPECRRQVKE